MSLQSSYVTTTTANIYVSSGETAAMTFYFSNYSTSSDATFSLWAVKSGNTASNLNILYSNVVVQAGDTYVADSERLFLDNNDALVAYANANVMSVTLTYTNV
jgi:hypothetical protein